MPTILNNSCVNRVPKVLKLKLTSNDLTELKSNPFLLFKIKDGQRYTFISDILVLLPSGHGYTGNMFFTSCGAGPLVNFSFHNDNTGDPIVLSATEGDGINCYLSVGSDFNIGDVRPDIEIHIYYYIELCTVNFDSNFILPDP